MAEQTHLAENRHFPPVSGSRKIARIRASFSGLRTGLEG